MLVVNMTAQKTINKTNIGGTSKSVSQLDPIFSYMVDGSFGVNIYVFKTKALITAIATFYDSISEVAYAVQTLTAGSEYEVIRLLKVAEEEFNDNENNPFHTLLFDVQALSELCRTVRSVVKGEKNE